MCTRDVWKEIIGGKNKKVWRMVERGNYGADPEKSIGDALIEQVKGY